jgi:hypothetical protein
MFLKKILSLLILSAICSLFGFSQSRFSPQMKSRAFRFDANQMLLSISVKDVAAFQKKYKGEMEIQQRHSGGMNFAIKVKHASLLNKLKEDSNILFVDVHQKPMEEAELDFSNMSFNRVTKVRQLMPGLSGLNQKISIKEQHFDSLNIDLKGRSFKTIAASSTSSQHATTMATLIAGGGNSSYHALGVAPQATFTSSDFSNLFPDDASVFNSNNIHLQNHSYGVGIENYYGNEAQAYDQQVMNNPTMLHVFSVGNSGQLQPPSGAYQGLSFATLTGNFKQAKNVLVINAVDTALTINQLNSRGPAFDGRLKPELTAYGQGGTSEATALVTGVCSLLQQNYFELYGKYPDASLVKAVLIASADDWGPAGIDFLYGYGNVNAYKALSLLQQGTVYESVLQSNDSKTLNIVVPSSVSVLKIAVAWSDAPAQVNASAALVNDIDAVLQNGSQVTLPWKLSSYPAADSLMTTAKRMPDHLNNVEYITLDYPAAGNYSLQLTSNTLSTADQKVSVAYWLEEQTQFEWDFPLAGDKVEAATKNLLVWQSQAGLKGDLYLQLNQSDWTLLKSNIDLDHYQYWKFPDTLAQARLKMVIGGNEFISGQFLISPLLKIKTAFSCADSVGLSWNLAKGAASYEIYTMGSSYLKKITATSDTLLVFHKPDDLYFSVAPVFDGLTGLKSETVNYTQQGAFCFINLFSAVRSGAAQVKTQLSLSSWYGIDHAVIYRTSRQAKEELSSIAPSRILAADVNDNNLLPGVLTYQAELFLKNGLTILSDAIDITVEEKGKAILYPNPLTNDSDLKIISEGDGVKFRIADCLGRIVFETTLELVQSSIDANVLPPGLYLYQLIRNSEVTDTGRFVKY